MAKFLSHELSLLNLLISLLKGGVLLVWDNLLGISSILLLLLLRVTVWVIA